MFAIILRRGVQAQAKNTELGKRKKDMARPVFHLLFTNGWQGMKRRSQFISPIKIIEVSSFFSIRSFRDNQK